ncbi:MAG: hypothetical protein NWP87_05430 [Winogradskyella sp.]|nr:hypothetical protein [Winogradskyella sp.]
MGVKLCLQCSKVLDGRSDKKYCDTYCKSSYQYQKSKIETPQFYKRVDRQLKRNRQLLKQYNKSGTATIRANILQDEGFNPHFFTHFWKNKKNDVYLFVYEYGFLKKKVGNMDKYVLVRWQDYMSH